MDDRPLVSRLRKPKFVGHTMFTDEGFDEAMRLCGDAADEIERLTTARDGWIARATRAEYELTRLKLRETAGGNSSE